MAAVIGPNSSVVPEAVARVMRKLTYANVMATVALFIALGGSSYAALSVTGKNVQSSSLTGRTEDIRNKSLSQKDFKGTVRGQTRPGGYRPARVRSAGPNGPHRCARRGKSARALGDLNGSASQGPVQGQPRDARGR